jgi:hypothetical protein
MLRGFYVKVIYNYWIKILLIFKILNRYDLCPCAPSVKTEYWGFFGVLIGPRSDAPLFSLLWFCIVVMPGCFLVAVFVPQNIAVPEHVDHMPSDRNM